jgi:hypothetical protein
LEFRATAVGNFKGGREASIKMVQEIDVTWLGTESGGKICCEGCLKVANVLATDTRECGLFHKGYNTAAWGSERPTRSRLNIFLNKYRKGII